MFPYNKRLLKDNFNKNSSLQIILLKRFLMYEIFLKEREDKKGVVDNTINLPEDISLIFYCSFYDITVGFNSNWKIDATKIKFSHWRWNFVLVLSIETPLKIKYVQVNSFRISCQLHWARFINISLPQLWFHFLIFFRKCSPPSIFSLRRVHYYFRWFNRHKQIFKHTFSSVNFSLILINNVTL